MASKMFLKIESADPKQFQGDSQDKDHQGWIDILRYTFGVIPSDLAPKPPTYGIRFVKSSNQLSLDWYLADKSGTELKRVLFHDVSTTVDGGTHSAWFEFHDAWFDRFIFAWQGEDILSIGYKSVSHHVGSPPASPKSGGKSASSRAATGGSSASAGAVSAGATALAMHMWR